MLRRWSIAPALSLAILLVGPSIASARKTSHSPAHRMAPAFVLPTTDGTVASDSLRGKVVLVDFWASWCGPCRGSFPWLAKLHERYGAQGLVIVAIDLDKSRDDANQFLTEFKPPFTVAFDPAGKTPDAYQVAVMPTTFLVGRDGTLLASHAGFDPKQTSALETRIKEECAK